MPSVYCFVFSYFFSFFIVMSSEDWFLIWMGLEINMMSFIMLIYDRLSMSSIESCFKYFFIQSLGSAILLSLFYSSIFSNSAFINLIMSYSIGAGPFFYWFPSMCMGIEWWSCFILMFFQKILPLMLISLFIHMILWMIMIIGIVVGVLGSFNQSNISQLMAYSSVHHLGWIMMVMMKSNMNWFLYLSMYGFMLFSIIIILIKYEIVNIYKIYVVNNKFWFMLGMLSMAGMPPLLGFFLKWMAFNFIVDMMLLFVILLLASVVMLYIYMQMVYDIMMMMKMKINLVEMIINKTYYSMDMVGVLGLNLGLLLAILLIF